jgi:hypothetical protein
MRRAKLALVVEALEAKLALSGDVADAPPPDAEVIVIPPPEQMPVIYDDGNLLALNDGPPQTMTSFPPSGTVVYPPSTVVAEFDYDGGLIDQFMIATEPRVTAYNNWLATMDRTMPNGMDAFTIDPATIPYPMDESIAVPVQPTSAY